PNEAAPPEEESERRGLGVLPATMVVLRRELVAAIAAREKPIQVRAHPRADLTTIIRRPRGGRLEQLDRVQQSDQPTRLDDTGTAPGSYSRADRRSEERASFASPRTGPRRVPAPPR